MEDENSKILTFFDQINVSKLLRIEIQQELTKLVGNFNDIKVVND